MTTQDSDPVIRESRLSQVIGVLIVLGLGYVVSSLDSFEERGVPVDRRPRITEEQLRNAEKLLALPPIENEGDLERAEGSEPAIPAAVRER